MQPKTYEFEVKRGQKSPLSFAKMITKEQIEKIVNEANKGTKRFLVDVNVAVGNKILVELDSLAPFNVQDCIEVSRFIESKLDRDVEDYELNVSSPGADRPFKVPLQYQKNVGRNLSVKLTDNSKLEATLLEVNDDTIVLESSQKEKVEGKKSKQLVTRQHNLLISEIKEAKVILSFK